MITLIISARTTPDRLREEAIDHLKRVHGPLVYDAPTDAGVMPSVYVQNHVSDELPLPPSLEAWRWDRHLVTQISFEQIDHLKASTATPYYLTQLKPDESRFVDHASVQPLVVAAPPRTDAGEATWKLLVYLPAAGRGTLQDAWLEAQDRAGPWCAAQSAAPAIDAPGAPPAFAAGLWSLWFQTADEARDFALDRLTDVLAPFESGQDAARGRIVLAEEFTVDRLRAETASIRLKAAS